jgi:hypothetical protein
MKQYRYCIGAPLITVVYVPIYMAILMTAFGRAESGNPDPIAAWLNGMPLVIFSFSLMYLFFGLANVTAFPSPASSGARSLDSR